MNNFDNIIMNQVSGVGYDAPANYFSKVRSMGRAFSNASGQRAAERRRYDGSRPENNHSTQLEKMSESALNNILSTYRKDILASGISEDSKAVLKSRIIAIEGELANRGSGYSSASIMADTSSMDAQEKKYQLGSTVGTSSLIFGVLGFMTSSLMGSKHPFMWGIASAGAGGTMAFFLSNDKSVKLIDPVHK